MLVKYILNCKKNYPGPGPPWVRSKTCRGLSSHWNFCNSLAPWLPPLLGLMKTSTGFTLAVGIGLITKVFCSPLESFPFFFAVFFFLGDFLNEDLKLPLLGNLTIHDGGTIMFDWMPVEYGISLLFAIDYNLCLSVFSLLY